MELNQILPSILLRTILSTKNSENFILSFSLGDKKVTMMIFLTLEDQVKEYFKPVEELISLIESLINK